MLTPRLSTDTLLGTQIAQLTGNDVDSGPALSYTLTLDGDAAGTFSVLRYGGRIALTGPLDYEQRSRYTLTLRASDTRHETEANLTIVVEDVNDNAPTFSQGFYQVACTPARRAARAVRSAPLCALRGTEIPRGGSEPVPAPPRGPPSTSWHQLCRHWRGQEAEVSSGAGVSSCGPARLRAAVRAAIGGDRGSAGSGGRGIATSASGSAGSGAPQADHRVSADLRHVLRL